MEHWSTKMCSKKLTKMSNHVSVMWMMRPWKVFNNFQSQSTVYRFITILDDGTTFPVKQPHICFFHYKTKESNFFYLITPIRCLETDIVGWRYYLAYSKHKTSGYNKMKGESWGHVTFPFHDPVSLPLVQPMHLVYLIF